VATARRELSLDSVEVTNGLFSG